MLHEASWCRALFAAAILLGIDLALPPARGAEPGFRDRAGSASRGTHASAAQGLTRQKSSRPSTNGQRATGPDEPARLADHRLATGRATTPLRHVPRPSDGASGSVWHEIVRLAPVLLGGALVFGLTWLLQSRSSLRPAGDRIAVLPPEERNAGSIDLVISNALPVVEEALALPRESQIFGRPLPAAPHRVDAAHVSSGPHYRVEPQPKPAGVPAAAKSPVDRGETDPTACSIRVDRAHPRSGPGALERARAALEGGAL